MDVQIPSPSVFLQQSPVVEPAPPPVAKKVVKPRTNANNVAKKASAPATTAQNAGVTKPKQSKSRNGCLTCKKKRLKCDENKPGCQQCQRRGVPCEGYRKDYKWRTFEETTFTTKPAGRQKKVPPASDPLPPRPSDAYIKHGGSPTGFSEGSGSSPDGQQHDGSPPHHYSHMPALSYGGSMPMPHLVPLPAQPQALPHLSPNPLFLPSFDSPSFLSFGDSPDHLMHGLANDCNSSVQSSLDGQASLESISTFSASSPSLRDLCLPGPDLSQPPEVSEPQQPPSPGLYQPNSFEEAQMEAGIAFDEEFDEEIVRQPMAGLNIHNHNTSFPSNWSHRVPSPTLSESSSESNASEVTIYATPSFHADSPEMIAARFDQQTCGILSVKDGLNENPWRTFVWPLAQSSPALYHALSSMAAFHASNERREMRLSGAQHMHKSIKSLSAELSNMELDAALATALALAFSESWDEHVSTGIQHLKGAKALVSRCIVKHRSISQMGQLDIREAMKMKFLCNTFVYMDVIARLTSLEEDNDFNFGEILETVNAPFAEALEVDPLLGCATTLFPLIGRVANLIQKVRKTEVNSIAIISQAKELKQLLEQWQLPNKMMFERPEDPSSEVDDSYQTAEAYRYATLLYLHQAVPEIPSETSHTLSRQVLMRIACVMPSSRATIVQIFPLLAASCEVESAEDRAWASMRWQDMMRRLKIGNVDKCVEVVQEVWRRRDAFEKERTDQIHRRQNSRGGPSTTFIAPMLNDGRKKVRTADVLDEGSFFGANGEMTDHVSIAAGRPSKRRFAMDTMGQPRSIPAGNGISMPPPSPALHRRTSDMMPESMEAEYTVRGRLHWIGVMRDWNWEILLG